MQAQEFIHVAAQANRTPIELTQAVLDRVSDKDVRDFAQREMDEHSKLNTQITTFAQRKGISLADQSNQQLIDAKKRLEGLSGVDLELRYMDEMVTEHEKAVSLFEQASERTPDADVKNLACDNLSIWREHLNNARKIAQRLKAQHSSQKQPS